MKTFNQLACRASRSRITLFLALLLSRVGASAQCPTDIDGNGTIDMGDISLVMLDFGPCAGSSPSISSVLPANGPSMGGTTVIIQGTGLSGASVVKFQGKPATSFQAVDDKTVTAVTPAGSVGASDVTVTTPAGTAVLKNGFNYEAWFTVVKQAPTASEVPDTTLRASIAATGLPWRVRDKGTRIEMVLVPPGVFTMGCSPASIFGTFGSCSSDELPNHAVALTKAFYIGVCEVSVSQWIAIMRTNPSGQADIFPVSNISWEDAQRFCAATSLRLPSEAEWEFAYRAGTTTAYQGFDDSESFENIGVCCGRLSVAGSKAPNGFGLVDMAGNVSEWCQDWYGPYSAGSQTNPSGPTIGTMRVHRGGSAVDWPFLQCRSSARDSALPSTGNVRIGFRVARSP